MYEHVDVLHGGVTENDVHVVPESLDGCNLPSCKHCPSVLLKEPDFHHEQ